MGQWPAGALWGCGPLWPCLPLLSVLVSLLSIFLSASVCYFLVLPSLSAPTLVSSSLTCWQDEVLRLPARSPQPEVCPRRGWGEWLATAWPSGPLSKLTDTLFLV